MSKITDSTILNPSMNPGQWYRVWDLPIRVFHWLLVVLVAVLWLTGEFGGLDVTARLPGWGDVYLSNMDIHAAAGQGVLVLVLFRVLWGIWGSTSARFSHFVRPPSEILAKLRDLLKGRVTETVGHNALGGIMVVAMTLLLLAQAASGLFSADDLFYEGPLTHLVDESVVKTLSGLHHQLFSVLQVLILLHILAILFYLFRRQNLIPAMVTGRKKLPQAPPLQFASAWRFLLTAAIAVGVLLALRSL